MHSEETNRGIAMNGKTSSTHKKERSTKGNRPAIKYSKNPGSVEYKESQRILRDLFGSVYQLKPKGVPFPAVVELAQENCRDLLEKFEEAERMSGILRNLKTEQIVGQLPPESSSMIKMLVYLGLVESLGVTLADIVLMLLIANGEDVHTRGPFTRHIKSFKELGEVELGYKLELLEQANLGIFQKILGREIRNNVAHLKFRIGEDGSIQGMGGNPINIDDALHKFWISVYRIMMILEEIGFMKWIRSKAGNERE